MRKKVRINQILIKIIAIILLAIMLFMYPIQSLAVGEHFKKQNKEEAESTEEGEKSSTTNTNDLAWCYPFTELKTITSTFMEYRKRFQLDNGRWIEAHNHKGLDFAAAAKTPILAISSGIVKERRYDVNHGYFIKVERSDGYVWIMKHFYENAKPNVNDVIKIGEPIAIVGNTGISRGNHLHIEIYDPAGNLVNPESVIDITTPGISTKSTSLGAPSNSLLIQDYKKMIHDGEFYYKGIPEGHFVKSQFNFLKWLVNFIHEIVDYLLGIGTLLFKIGILGWGILIETSLTSAFDSLVVKNKGSGNYRKGNTGFYTDSKRTVNVENIFFNRVEVLNVNFFETKESVKKRLLRYSPTGLEIDQLYGTGSKGTEDSSEVETSEIDELEDGPLLLVKDYFSMIFLLMYFLALLMLLAALIINAIMAAVETVGAKKATYKQRARDWLKAFVEALLLLIYMITILYVHTWAIDFLAKLSDTAMSKTSSFAIQTDMGQNYTIMETLRTRAYNLKFSVGFPATIMYLVLIWFTFKFLLIYLKRFLVVFFLSILGPVLMVYDLIIKTIRGESTVRIDWLKEYTFNVLIQVVHAFIYMIFIPIAYMLATKSIMGFIIMFIILQFILKADKIIRQIFNISGSKRHSTLENVLEKSSIKDYAKGFVIGGILGKGTVGRSVLNKVKKPIMKPIKVAAGTVGSGLFRGGYNVVQAVSEHRKKKRIAKGGPEISEGKQKRLEKKDKKVADTLRRLGYSDDEIDERLRGDGPLKLTEEQKDRIRFIEGLKLKRRKRRIRGINKIKYTANKFKRSVSGLGTVDEKGRKRIKGGRFEVDPITGKIKFKDGLRDKFRKSLIKEFDMGKGKLGEKELDKTIADIKKAGKFGLQAAAGLLMFPISFADPSIPDTLYATLMTNLQFNSKRIKLTNKRPASVKQTKDKTDFKYQPRILHLAGVDKQRKQNKKAERREQRESESTKLIE